MSTPCIIAVSKTENEVEVIRCNNDGYPHYTGAILLNSYETLEKATALVKGGSLKFIGDTCEQSNPPEDKEYYRRCQYYNRDLGYALVKDTFSQAEFRQKLEQGFYREMTAVYWFKNGKWFYFNSHASAPRLKTLTRELCLKDYLALCWDDSEAAVNAAKKRIGIL